MRVRSILLLSVCGSLFWFPACTRKISVVRRAPYTTLIRREAGLTPDQEKNRDFNCFEGCPVLSPSAGFGPTAMIYRKGYVLQHSAVDRIPIWVAEHVVAEQLDGDLERNNAFAPDPDLPAGKRAELIDYKHSGFDRGHQAPAGNQTTDVELKRQTFYLSNMCPQVGTLNQQKWKQLEEKTRAWVKQFHEAWEITGPLFYDPKEDNPATADGMVTFLQIGPGNVSVPTHFFKIVIAKNGTTLQAIGFVMENRGYPKSFDLASAIQPLRWIEEHSGLDFMPNLDAGEQNRLETPASAMWP